MKRSLFWSLFGPQLIILLACILGLTGYAWKSRRTAISREWRHVLETQAALASHLVLDDNGGLRPPDHLRQLGRRLLEDSQIRLTVLRSDGRVLFDSEAHSDAMLLHDDRPEFIEALRKGYGHSERYSTTLRQMLHYVARAVRNEAGDTLAVVRVAVPRHQIDAPVQRSMWFFAGLLATIVLSSVGLSYLFARRVTIPVRDMRAGLQRLGDGDWGHKLQPPRIRHLAALAVAINETGDRLQSQVRQIEAEHALREGILAGMREGVVALDGKRRIVLLNPAARELLDVGTREVTGQPLELAVPNIELIELVDAAAAESGPLTAELDWRTPNHMTHLLAATAAWTSADGRTGGLLILLKDLTQLRRLEQIRRDFVANVSHELRTPITSIKGFAEILHDAPPDDAPTRLRFLEIILRQTEQMETILNDMLLLARLEDAGTALARETVDAAALIDGAGEICQARAASAHVALRCDVQAGLVFQGHRHLLEQALVNLIDNAIKYGGADKTVTVSATQRNQTVLLTVQDQGPGIDTAQAARVFERFYRIDAGRSREQGGSGLGLAVVKHVVRVHQGTVSVENLPQGGCAFTLALPTTLPPLAGAGR